MRLLGVPIETPQTVVNRVLSDLGAVARLARLAPAKLDRLLELGEEMADIGHNVLAVAERLERQTDELLELGRGMREMGERIDARGAAIVEKAGDVVETGSELIQVLPALERALEMATPLEGAIDRFGRLVDRLPGGAPRRRPEARPPRPEDPGPP